MAATIDLKSLMDRARERADMVSSPFVTDTELQEMVRRSAAELYDRLIVARGEEYYAITSTPMYLDATTLNTLPTDFYRLLALRVSRVGQVVTDGRGTFPRGDKWHTCEPFNRTQIGHYRTMQDKNIAPTCAEEFRYRLGGTTGEDGTIGYDVVQIFPAPVATNTWIWEIDYIPTSLVHSDGVGPVNMTIDGIDGWDDYVVWDCAAQMVAKEERDPSVMLMKLAAVQQRIDRLAGSRDDGKPEVAPGYSCRSRRVYDGRWR